MSTNTFFIDAASRHAVFVQRYANGIAKTQKAVVNEALDEAERIVNQYDLLSLSISDQASMQYEIYQVLSRVFDKNAETLAEEFIRFAVSEAEFSAQMFGAAVKTPIEVPEVTPMQTIMSVAPGGVSVEQALKKYGTARAADIVREIQDGVTKGRTSQEVGRRIHALAPMRITWAQSLVRTIVNHISSNSRLETLQKNRRIFDGYEWVSTLDARTSDICKYRDGMIYPISASSPMPPAHWSCRSTVVPKVKDEFNLLKDVEGDRPSVGSNGAERVSAKTTYSGWLRKQSIEFQNEALGETKARLFRSGKLTLGDFVDESGRTYTLDELRALNPLAFN